MKLLFSSEEPFCPTNKHASRISCSGIWLQQWMERTIDFVIQVSIKWLTQKPFCQQTSTSWSGLRQRARFPKPRDTFQVVTQDTQINTPRERPLRNKRAHHRPAFLLQYTKTEWRYAKVQVNTTSNIRLIQPFQVNRV